MRLRGGDALPEDSVYGIALDGEKLCNQRALRKYLSRAFHASQCVMKSRHVYPLQSVRGVIHTASPYKAHVSGKVLPLRHIVKNGDCHRGRLCGVVPYPLDVRRRQSEVPHGPSMASYPETAGKIGSCRWQLRRSCAVSEPTPSYRSSDKL